MSEVKVVFDDGAVYEQAMGQWSLLVGAEFLDWLAPQSGLRWLDVGCGSGAFAELLMQRCAPAELHAVDPSEAQIAYARQREGACGVTFHLGNAMALPFPDRRFDAVVMALVIAFVPDPAGAVAEMVRVATPGAMVATYMWDMLGEGGSPMWPVTAELRAAGIEPATVPGAPASRAEALQSVWQAAGLEAIEACSITARRIFADFDTFWDAASQIGTLRPTLAGLSPTDVHRVRQAVRARLPADENGRISYSARANAIKGRVPA